ncbi:hypothetical protein [Mycolicibacterium baixiangningiae]|uniref:hypothetical protein n=1 Tax=Mycolicibacterium baixiangningiae TaxID=2761578 RepID=UPI00186773D8|nr:hypothetical protein [Mycolicibacterium baixiangningiae]
MIAAVTGVVLSPEDAEFIVGALDEFTRVLAERRSSPSSRLAGSIEQLRRATRKCGALSANATPGRSSSADETETGHDASYATCSTVEAARILGVGASAVRNSAQRNPRKLGSRRVGNRWTHDLARVEYHAARRKGRR